MTNTRRRRLLLLAKRYDPATQRYYAQYCTLMGEGLVGWTLGAAFITEKGEEWLIENSCSRY